MQSFGCNLPSSTFTRFIASYVMKCMEVNVQE